MDSLSVSQEEIREFTRKKWREYPRNPRVMRKCERCFKEWEINGRRRGEEKPLCYPGDYNGKCLCGGELSQPQFRCGI